MQTFTLIVEFLYVWDVPQDLINLQEGGWNELIHILVLIKSICLPDMND